MNRETLEKQFALMGARVQIPEPLPRVAGWGGIAIDVIEDRRGELFEIRRSEAAPDLEILQVLPSERHLLLYARDGQRFLCGHDERHWFVAAIGDRVSTVRAAKRSLIPKPLAERTRTLSTDDINRRKNEAFKRQGEWFFVPVGIDVPPGLIHRDEPLQRSPRNKPHLCQELYRKGGTLVYIVNGRVMSAKEYERARANPSFRLNNVQTRVSEPEVYVRGAVRHEDHATLVLNDWHRVYLNGEKMTESVRFLD